MYLLRNLIYLGLIITFSSKIFAVRAVSRSIKNQKIYGIEFSGDTRGYYGDENAIQSISVQEYITTAFFVTEVNVVTQGTGLLRIYHSRPLHLSEIQKTLGETVSTVGLPGASSIIQRPLPPKIQTMADRASGASTTAKSRSVIKEYPIATHAHTIEYQIANLDELLELYDELKKHWLKEPAYYEAGQVLSNDQVTSTSREMKPRSLGGTLFKVQDL